jgi:hypothetical protein
LLLAAGILAGVGGVCVWFTTDPSESVQGATPVAPKVNRPIAFPKLEAQPSKIDLGVVPPASRLRAEIHLFNPHSQKVTIERVETSCDCLQPLGLPWSISPNQMSIVPFEMDLGHEPRFRGGLGIGATGRTSDDNIAFEIKVEVEVRETKQGANKGS